MDLYRFDLGQCLFIATFGNVAAISWLPNWMRGGGQLQRTYRWRPRSLVSGWKL